MFILQKKKKIFNKDCVSEKKWLKIHKMEYSTSKAKKKSNIDKAKLMKFSEFANKRHFEH